MKRGKIGENGKNGRMEDKGGKERTREKGRLGSPEAVGLLHDIADTL